MSVLNDESIVKFLDIRTTGFDGNGHGCDIVTCTSQGAHPAEYTIASQVSAITGSKYQDYEHSSQLLMRIIAANLLIWPP